MSANEDAGAQKKEAEARDRLRKAEAEAEETLEEAEELEQESARPEREEPGGDA